LTWLGPTLDSSSRDSPSCRKRSNWTLCSHSLQLCEALTTNKKAIGHQLRCLQNQFVQYQRMPLEAISKRDCRLMSLRNRFD
jgi:hypothetical protein